jgi:hypothetical protein
MRRAPSLVSRIVARVCLALVLALVAVAVLAAMAGVAGGAYVALKFPSAPAGSVVEVSTRVLAAEVGEDPHLPANPPSGPLPLCESVPPQSERPLAEAFGLMRATDEGQRLYEMLVTNGICIQIEDLAYNAGYSRPTWSAHDGWHGSVISVDRSLVRTSSEDVLAALFVHEATHMARAVDETGCWVGDSCTMLRNGVMLEEEIAAHAAEASWWIAMFGVDGKRFALSEDAGENRLASAYREGDAAFTNYVREYRSGSREGEGIR